MTTKLNKKTAVLAGNAFDQAAEMVERLASMGVVRRDIAKKYAYQCDLLSDHAAKVAGVDVSKLAQSRKQALTGDDVFDEGAHIGKDPEQIGEETGGPLEQEPDEPYMEDHFTQQENRELRQKQEDGEMPGVSDRRDAEPGIQASMNQGKRIAALYMDINDAADRCASSKDVIVQRFGQKLAALGLEVLGFHTRLLEGSESTHRVASVVKAATHVLPHLAYEVPSVAVPKLTRMAGVFTEILKSK